MFTGIIEQTARVIRNEPQEAGYCLVVDALAEGLALGESIALNGVCLTLAYQEREEYHFNVSPETLGLTNLGALKPDMLVNWEPALAAQSRLGGHYVSGHVHTQAFVASIEETGEYWTVKLEGFTSEEQAYLVPKGSITVDGVSLTLNAVSPKGVELMLIPHTLKATNLNLWQPGQRVNIEFDYIARIVAHQLQACGMIGKGVEHE